MIVTKISVKVVVALMGVGFASVALGAAGLRVIVTAADRTGVRDSTVAIQRCLDRVCSAGGGTVYLPPGEYRIGTLSLGWNTRFELAGGAGAKATAGWTPEAMKRAMDPAVSAIIRTTGKSVCNIFLYNLVPPSSITNGCGNIAVEGGTFDCADRMKVLAFMCAKGVRVSNMVVKDLPNNHAFQIGGCSDVEIRNCLFAGYHFGGKNGSCLTRETIQLETTSPAAITGSRTPCAPIFCPVGDYRPNRRVTVAGCWFGASERRGSQLIPLGHHGAARSCNGLVFTGNVIDNPRYCGLRLANVSDVLLANNTFIATNAKKSLLETDSAFITIWGKAALGRREKGIVLRDNTYRLSPTSSFPRLWVSPARKREVQEVH